MDKVYIAHKNDKNEIQTVKQHAEETAELCQDYAIPEWKDFMYILGLLHDCGKYMESFQRKIKYDESIHVEHSICGAKEAYKKWHNSLGIMMAYCIAGHHTGLPDGGSKKDTKDKSTLNGRLARETEDYSVFQQELLIPTIEDKKWVLHLMKECQNDLDKVIDQYAFWTRYAFSCLVDADSINTAEFCNKKRKIKMNGDFQRALSLVSEEMGRFQNKNKTELQKSRAYIQIQALQKVNVDANIYLMNMPTGSGKTLCSVKFALERAIKQKKKRIIYIIPYNGIIDQTATTFQKMFGSAVDILRHQSTFDYETENMSQEKINKMRMIAENWDAPFIITTAVQFFESIYKNNRSRLRKMHNMADSILVFDEIHTVPTDYLQPCLQAIGYITKYLNSEAVLMTATMPNFKSLIEEYVGVDNTICDLITDTSLFPKFEKCKYTYIGPINYRTLFKKIKKFPSSLVIVNRKETARKLYGEACGKKYHLSTYMTAYDRKRVIKSIGEDLDALERDFKDESFVPEDRRITVISTSLIEAGVDLDFHVVCRELSGLDSILQAGGRCNREGLRKKAEVIIFEDAESYTIENERTNITKELLVNNQSISSKECIEEYYNRVFFTRKSEITKFSMHQYCEKNGSKDINSIPFSEYADKFKIIDDERAVSIVVERDEISRKCIEELKMTRHTDMRKLQNYVCSVNNKEFENMKEKGFITDYESGVWCLKNPDYYDENVGILTSLLT